MSDIFEESNRAIQNVRRAIDNLKEIGKAANTEEAVVARDQLELIADRNDRADQRFRQARIEAHQAAIELDIVRFRLTEERHEEWVEIVVLQEGQFAGMIEQNNEIIRLLTVIANKKGRK